MYTEVENVALQRTLQLIFLLMFFVLVAYLISWMSYGRLRHFALPRTREDVRRANIILTSLVGVSIVIALVWCIAIARAGMPVNSPAAVVAVCVLLAALVAVGVLSILTLTSVVAHWERARTYTLLSAVVCGSVFLLAFVGLFVASYQRAVSKVTEAKRTSI